MSRASLPLIPVVAAAMALLAGCSSIERSRALADPRVPVVTTAQQVGSNCHGLDGNSVSPNFPRLAAQSPEYPIKQLKDFRGHDRRDPPGYEYMWGISRSLTDSQIDGLARYFAQQKPRANGPVDSRIAARCERIFRDGIPDRDVPPCSACHGESGQGNEAFQRLAGQHADDVAKQLRVFQRGDARPAPVMQAVSHSLQGPDIAAVASYLQGLGAASP